jgi:glutamate synthase (NADPH/NADH) small chain
MAAELKKNKMALLNLKIRNNSFLEAALGYTPEQAMKEAGRCQSCTDKSCTSGCPLNVDIPSFIAEVAKGNFEAAYEIISRKNLLPSTCSRICSADAMCERGCKLNEPVAIAALERFAADYHRLNGLEVKNEANDNGHKVAVVGTNPAALGCAGELLRRGYEVTIFESAGTNCNIPEFRLPKAILKHDLNTLAKLGAEIVTRDTACRTDEAEELLAGEDFDAVYYSENNELPGSLNIKGEELKGVITADSFLSWVSTKAKDKYYIDAPNIKKSKAVVIGGNVKALDAARSMRRFGADVTVIFRSSEGCFEAGSDEIKMAKEEGVKFMFLTDLIELTGNREGHVTGVYCEKLMLTKAVNSDREELIPLYESEFEIPADHVIIVPCNTGTYCEAAGDENGTFTFKGASTDIYAIAAGKNDAAVIDDYVTRKVRV